ncbi:MAG: metallophosphoesterase [Oscillospiraceae bacterium]|nr:metallophosphoesterase [Oscillospiraceae bacterium]
MANQRPRFHRGRFKLLQITDIQDYGNVSRHTLELLEAALDLEKPDLVVFTGDQIAGEMPSMNGKKGPENVAKTIRQLLAPLEAREIFFTFTFGNHDMMSGTALREQFAVYAASPCCLAEDTPGVSGCGNHSLPIWSEDGSRTAFNLYLLDSHGAAHVSGYAPLEPDQVGWYRRTRDALAAENGGQPVPSLLFQHIPPPNVYDILLKTKKAKTAVRGFRGRRNTYYKLDPENSRPGGVFLEAPCVPDTDAGLFAAALEQRDILGMYFGHDHKNTFEGKLGGIALGYTPSLGMVSYGNGLGRGLRVFELNENAPADYKTRILHIPALLPEKKLPLSARLMDMTPTSVEDAVPKLVKLLLGILGIAALVIALIFLL